MAPSCCSTQQTPPTAMLPCRQQLQSVSSSRSKSECVLPLCARMSLSCLCAPLTVLSVPCSDLQYKTDKATREGVVSHRNGAMNKQRYKDSKVARKKVSLYTHYYNGGDWNTDQDGRSKDEDAEKDQGQGVGEGGGRDVRRDGEGRGEGGGEGGWRDVRRDGEGRGEGGVVV